MCVTTWWMLWPVQGGEMEERWRTGEMEDWRDGGLERWRRDEEWRQVNGSVFVGTSHLVL